ncbi:MAG: amino acid permease, partial [Sphingobium sp.]
MIFGRRKSLDLILATAEKKALHRSLGAFQLTILGIGAVIGTGIFVLTSEAAQKAGPAMLLSFTVAGLVCAVAALCYCELASMVPVSGSAYTYSYAVVGEVLAWTVGWALILEYALGASAVAVGWSNHAVPLLRSLGVSIPAAISNSDALMAQVQMALGDRSSDVVNAVSVGGWINLPAALICAVTTWLLVRGTQESARFNAVLVAVKIAALVAFIALTLPVVRSAHFQPFMPTGSTGVLGAAASIFFAYVGFDAVSTAAEETRN